MFVEGRGPAHDTPETTAPTREPDAATLEGMSAGVAAALTAVGRATVEAIHIVDPMTAAQLRIREGQKTADTRGGAVDLGRSHGSHPVVHESHPVEDRASRITERATGVRSPTDVPAQGLTLRPTSQRAPRSRFQGSLAGFSEMISWIGSRGSLDH